MKTVNFLTLTFLTILALTSCSSGGGDGTSPDYSSIALQLTMPGLDDGALLSHGGQTTVRAYLYYTEVDEEGKNIFRPYPKETTIHFYVKKDNQVVTYAGTVDATQTTRDGYAEVTYNAADNSGNVTVYAETDVDTAFNLSTVLEENIASGEVTFEVATNTPVSIITDSITPDTIGVIGSGRVDGQIFTSTLQFFVTDGNGQPVPDGSTVQFSISTPLGGGERLTHSEGQTVNGLVSVNLLSGTVSGTARINASFIDPETASTISTIAEVTIVSGLPTIEKFEITAQYLNMAVRGSYDMTDEISAYLADRYGNLVPDGTPVSFMSECGTIGTNDGFQPTDDNGVAGAILRASPPIPTNGRCTIVAYTPGEEGFADINGNNVFDKGIDSLRYDLGEPYIDANEDGAYDPGEIYIDNDGSGTYTQADGVFQANTIIWRSVIVVFSSDQDSLRIDPDTFTIVPGSSQDFTYVLGDIAGNSLVGGTKVNVTSSEASITLTGDTDVTVGDTTSPKQQYSFTAFFANDSSATSATIDIEVTPASGSAGANSDSSITESAVGSL